MEIQKQNLLKALQIVKPGLASHQLIEQGTSFCFIDGYVMTYNDDISVRCPVKDLKKLTGAINAFELYDYINRIKTEEITFNVDEKEILIKAGRSKAGFVLENEILLPVEEIGNIKNWKKLPDNFLKAIKFCAAACAKSDNKPILTCIHVNEDIIEGAEHHRIANYTLSNTLKINPFLLPASSVNDVIKFQPIEIANGENWIHFKNEEKAIMSCRIVEENYVETEKHFKIKGKKIIFPKTLPETIDRARVFSKEKESIMETIEIQLEKGKLCVSSKSQSGWFKETLRNKEYEGESIEFLITPYLLKDIINESYTAIIDDTKLIFKGKGWEYLTMLKTKSE
jgi:DNA polymerase III sliding clamp (beta) subunit (PCNA family)